MARNKMSFEISGMQSLGARADDEADALVDRIEQRTGGQLVEPARAVPQVNLNQAAGRAQDGEIYVAVLIEIGTDDPRHIGVARPGHVVDLVRVGLRPAPVGVVEALGLHPFAGVGVRPGLVQLALRIVAVVEARRAVRRRLEPEAIVVVPALSSQAATLHCLNL